MAGTLTISTLSDGTNSTSATNCIQGSTRAWGSFNGNAGVSAFTYYNVSSVTRNSTGVYTVAFTNAMANANYTVVATAGSLTNTTKIATPNTPTTTNFKIETLSTTWGTQDCYWTNFAVFA